MGCVFEGGREDEAVWSNSHTRPYLNTDANVLKLFIYSEKITTGVATFETIQGAPVDIQLMSSNLSASGVAVEISNDY